MCGICLWQSLVVLVSLSSSERATYPEVHADLAADSSSTSFEALLLIKSTLICTHVVKGVI